MAALGLASGIAFAGTTLADYPEQDIRLVIPYGPGGATDVIFRLVSQEAEKHLGVSIVPVNMAGAGATLGSRHVKDARPDGYTLLGSHDTIALSKLAGTVDYSYDAFEPVALLTQTIVVPMTHAEHPVNDASEMLDYIHDNPGQVRFGMIPSSVDHFFWAQLFNVLDVSTDEVRFIGYQDTAEQISALMAKDIDFVNADMPSSKSFFESGLLRPLGVAHAERLDELPDTPTLRELGIDFVSSTNRGIFAPKGTPQEVIDSVVEAYAKAVENEDVRRRIENEFGSVVHFLSGDDYQAFLNETEAALAAAAENIDFQN
ncbi:Bug family tripartite tricarboxylate transporter substrate binding protein [Halomonas sp. A29]|uniref:Bug family tripartite tricarboxylate transporter substrate binding protein n=1 Tax=Halomonas sp. A29 TaxID=3102786 RepID=UPI00398B42A5